MPRKKDQSRVIKDIVLYLVALAFILFFVGPRVFHILSSAAPK